MRNAAPLAAILIVLSFSRGVAGAKDEVKPLPEGVSTRQNDDHIYKVVVPKAADAKPPYSLLLVIQTGGTAPEQYLPLAKEGWVVLLREPKKGGSMFATSETKDIFDDIDAVVAACPVRKDGMHCLTIDDRYGFASFVAFEKRFPCASLSFSTSEWSGTLRGKSPPAEAKKRIGVLMMGEGKEPSRFGDPVKICADFAEKVRTAEYRRDEDPFKPYFRWWLSVMDGRFTPGHDLSFAWIADPPSPPPPKAGEKAPPPPQSALDSAKASAMAKGAGAFVYFWSADDASSNDARSLQTEVFLDAGVRAAAEGLFPVKLERARYAEAFAAFDLKTTPAVVVVDSAFAVQAKFEGPVPAKALVKALQKAGGGKAK